MKTPKLVTVPLPKKIRRLLDPKGLRGRILLTSADGEPVSASDVKEVAGLIAMLDIIDARTLKALAAVARIIPASMVPTLGEAEKAAAKTSRKPAAKRARSRR